MFDYDDAHWPRGRKHSKFESCSLDCRVWYTLYERYRRPRANIIVSRAAVQQQHSSSSCGSRPGSQSSPTRSGSRRRGGGAAPGGVYQQRVNLQRGLCSSSTRRADLSTSKRKAPVPTLTQQQQQQQQQQETADQAARALR